MRKNQRKIEANSCPFCGDDWIEVYESVYGGFFVECQNCGANIGSPDREEFAINAWNDRAVPIYNLKNLKVGDKRFCICTDYKGYIIRELICKKISRYDNKKTNYTFKESGNYRTYTFRDSSFGKKIFDTYEEAEVGLKKLNKD